MLGPHFWAFHGVHLLSFYLFIYLASAFFWLRGQGCACVLWDSGMTEARVLLQGIQAFLPAFHGIQLTGLCDDPFWKATRLHGDILSSQR
jgi:hypothetical protein